MNADLKRVRSTGFEDGPSPIKRRATGTSSPPPAVNIEDAGMEEWQKVMETHRKEAIYRQMMEYRRGQERERQRADAIEQQRVKLQASVEAVEVCWNQLVHAVQAICPSGNSDGADPIEAGIDGEVSHEELREALAAKLPITQNLISKVIQAVPGKTSSTEDVMSRCMHLQAESSTLRASSRHLKSQMAILTDSRDAMHRDLVKAQKALDRQRMEHDKAEKEWRIQREREQDQGSRTPAGDKAANGSGHATPNGTMGNEYGKLPEGPSTILQDTSALEAKAEQRLKALEALRSEHTALQQEHDRIRFLASHPSEEALRLSPFFQVYLHQLAAQTDRAASLQQRCETVERQLDQLRDNNYEFQQAMIKETGAEAEVLRQQNARKDGDLARLRGQRDDLTAELAERKARDTDKMTFAGEMEKLAKSREERVRLLSSEVLRLKGKLGAESGSAGYLAFLRGEGGIDGDYIKHLETKIENLEGQVATLRDQLQQASDGQLSSATDLAVEMEQLKRYLSKYERILGPNPEAAEDVQNLARQLEASDKDRESLKLQLAEAEASTNALYTEVEGLSKLWEGLEKTVNSKVFDLRAAELKVERLGTEKAKADNKYFQAMRLKEGIDAECKTAQRSVEKQLKMLEKAQEVEKALNVQLSTHDKGLTVLKNQAMDLQGQLAIVTSEKMQLETRLQQSQVALADAQSMMKHRVNDHAIEKAAREKLEEQVESSAREINALKERQETITASGGTVDPALQAERDKLFSLLRCSACALRFKQQVITRCFHTFCAQCLDDRIASRQRKCPACGLAFAKEDVQTLYWQ